MFPGRLPHERYEDCVPLQQSSPRPRGLPSRCLGKDAVASQVWTGCQHLGAKGTARLCAVWPSPLPLPQLAECQGLPGWRLLSTLGGNAQWGAECFDTLYFPFRSHGPRIFVSVGARRKQLALQQSRTPAAFRTPAWRLSARTEERQGHGSS